MKNLPIYVLSGALIFLGLTNGSSASGASTLDARVKALESQVKLLTTLRDIDAKQIYSLQNCVLIGTGQVMNNGNSSSVPIFLPLAQCRK